MKKIIILFTIIAASFAAQAQNATMDKNGNFIAISSTSKPAKSTGKFHTDKDGKRSEVFLSAKGKYFINRISKETGNPYKYYLTTTAKK